MKIINLPKSIELSNVESLIKGFINLFEKNHSVYAHITRQLDLKISFDKLGIDAGEADWKQSLISINIDMVEKYPHMLKEVLGHELCHVVVNKIYQKAMGHGTEWEKAMMALNITPRACHDLNLEEFRLPNQIAYAYKCQCSSYKISPEKHNQVEKSGSICKKCKSQVVFVSKIEGQKTKEAA